MSSRIGVAVVVGIGAIIVALIQFVIGPCYSAQKQREQQAATETTTPEVLEAVPDALPRNLRLVRRRRTPSVQARGW